MALELTTEQVPSISDPPITETALIVHPSEKENSEDIISGKKDSEDEPLTKKLKVLIPTLEIPTPTPLSSLILKHLLNPLQQKLSVEQFTDQLFSTTSSSFAPSPPREPTPLRDPSKGKGVPFVTPEGILSQEDIMAQLKEMKRLAELKAKNEKSESSLKKMFNPSTVRAQAHKMAKYEQKKAKMLDEYNKCIHERADQLPITKISYKKFRLKTLGFSEWLEVQALASKNSSKSNDLLLQSLRAKFNRVISQAKKLGVSPPPELANFRVSYENKKRKRS
ncbi:hypothetical protein Tco_1205260 [Tanacetum coccineum]